MADVETTEQHGGTAAGACLSQATTTPAGVIASFAHGATPSEAATAGQVAFVADADLAVTSWHDAGEQMYGWSAAEASGRNLLALLGVEPKAATAADLLLVLVSGQCWSDDLWVQDRHGRRFPVSLTVSPVFDAEGHLQANICTSTDLSDWYRAQGERETIERRYHQGFEDSAVGVAILDLDVRYLRVNPAFCALVGREESELVGRHPDELGVQREGMSISDQVDELCRNESGSLQTENSFELGDGSVVSVLVTGTLIRDERGEPEYLFVQVQDISARKRAELGRAIAEATLRGAFDDFVAAVAKTAELRDPYTAGHQERVTEFATLIAGQLGVDAETLHGIRVAATIHDLGKLTIPAEILNRPGRLSAAELESIEQHPRTGYDIVKDVEFPWPIARVILEHHERMDGSGYPRGLVGDEILLESRIVAVADVLDAVSSHRPYRPAKGIDAAVEILLAGRGTLYDADVVDACLRVAPETIV